MTIDVPLGKTPQAEVLAILKFHTFLFSSDLAMFVLATRYLGFSPLYNIWETKKTLATLNTYYLQEAKDAKY